MMLNDDFKAFLISAFKSALPYLIGAILCLILLAHCKGCKSEPIVSVNSNKDTIRLLQIKVDSFHVVRTNYVKKYRTIRDTINIHDTIQVVKELQLCDTIIVVDSIEIAFLKSMNRNFYRIVKSDSLVIDSLTRSKKKYWRGFRNGVIAGSVITGGLIWSAAIK